MISVSFLSENKVLEPRNENHTNSYIVSKKYFSCFIHAQLVVFTGTALRNHLKEMNKVVFTKWALHCRGLRL